MPARTLPAVKPDAKRLHILEAARRLLARRGFADTVLDDIAKAAGVAKGTLYLHFRDKEELFLAAFEELVDRLGKDLDVLAASPLRGETLLAETVRTLLQHFDRNHDFVAQLGATQVPGCGAGSGGKLMEKFSANHHRLARVLALCCPRTAAERDKPPFASFALMALCRGAMMRKTMTGSDRPLESQTKAIVDFFLDGAGRPG